MWSPSGVAEERTTDGADCAGLTSGTVETLDVARLRGGMTDGEIIREGEAVVVVSGEDCGTAEAVGAGVLA